MGNINYTVISLPGQNRDDLKLQVHMQKISICFQLMRCVINPIIDFSEIDKWFVRNEAAGIESHLL